MTRTRSKAEFGDFQTPRALAKAVCELLLARGTRPAALLEPNCGLGNLLFAGLDRFRDANVALGFDINAGHLQEARTALEHRHDRGKVELIEADFYATDWPKVLDALPAPILVLGNPPWVTNSRLGALESDNLPTKSNLHGWRGVEAITGKANFDISEWMLIQLIEALNGRQGTLAMLCKSAVARKVLGYAWKKGMGIANSAIYRIDADLHFDAAVDAALLVTQCGAANTELHAAVFSSLQSGTPETVIGYEEGTLLADIDAYRGMAHLRGEEAIKWRSGVKHDCAKVMELKREGTQFRNGFGELASLEDDYVYPLLKSSQIAKKQRPAWRYVIVPQKTIGEDTRAIEETAPRTWNYLTSHGHLFQRRASTIYRNRPPFSVFGVGEYSFSPWKVAISGFYKTLSFVPLGPIEGKPVMLDDTAYFLPCRTGEQAEFLASLLNSPAAQTFYRSLVFWDAKRPVTADLLRRLDLRRLASELTVEDRFSAYFGKPNGLLFA